MRNVIIRTVAGRETYLANRALSMRKTRLASSLIE